MKRLIYFLIFMPLALIAQDQVLVTGTVVGGKPEMPIAGASVYVSSSMVGNQTDEKGILQGAMLGTTTDFDGNFELRVDPNIKSLVISYMGFESKTIELGNNTKNLRITLKESSENLDEVIITGYQKIEKRKATSAYAKVDVAEIEQGFRKIYTKQQKAAPQAFVYR